MVFWKQGRLPSRGDSKDALLPARAWHPFFREEGGAWKDARGRGGGA